MKTCIILNVKLHFLYLVIVVKKLLFFIKQHNWKIVEFFCTKLPNFLTENEVPLS